MRKANTVGEAKQQQEEKTYRKPQLAVYGDVRQITGNVGSKGSDDGGGGAGAGPKTGA